MPAAPGAMPYPSSTPAAPAAPSVALVLPPGALVHNGGILYGGPAVFSNSYRVPGPGGRDWLYYDASVPHPPADSSGSTPSLREQWQGLTGWLQLFVAALFAFWVLQLSLDWRVGLCLPLLFLPTYLLHREWRRLYPRAELLLLTKLYALAFVPGAIVTMLIEGALQVLFMLICFRSLLAKYLQQMANGGGKPDPSDPSTGGDERTPPGMEFLRYGDPVTLFAFLFLLSYVTAAGTEEGLKYWLIKRVKR